MRGPMYIERNLSLDFYKERCSNLLKKRIDGIKHRKNPYVSYNDDLIHHADFISQARQNSSIRIDIYKIVNNYTIRRNNAILLSRLEKISERRFVIYKIMQKTIREKLKCSKNRINKSLTFDIRKKESNRIILENMRLAKKLVYELPTIKFSNIKKDYRRYVKYKKLLMRMQEDNTKNQNKKRNSYCKRK